MKRLFLFLMIFLPTLVFAANNSFKEGVDYQLIEQNANMPTLPQGKISVTEFFSYGCPWCYQLEPNLEKWLKNQPNNISFDRVPVIFEKYWNNYAKAYYLADALGITSKITPAMFDLIQEQNKELASTQAMIDFFVKHGVKEDIATSALTSSPAIDAQVKQGVTLMQAYQVYAVPSFVINGKYRTDLAMAKSNERLLKIVSYLVNKQP